MDVMLGIVCIHGQRFSSGTSVTNSPSQELCCISSISKMRFRRKIDTPMLKRRPGKVPAKMKEKLDHQYSHELWSALPNLLTIYLSRKLVRNNV